MENLNRLIFILIAIISLSASAQNNEDINSYFDDDGMDERKNIIFTDVNISYVYRPFYTLGYMYRFRNNFVLSGGILMTKSNYIYNYNMNTAFLYDKNIPLKSKSTNIHYFFELAFKNNIFRNSWNRSGFGMEYYQFDLSNIYHYYITQTLFSRIFMNNHLFMAIDFQVGARIFHLNDLYFSKYQSIFIFEPIESKQFSLFINIPLKIGFHF